MGLKGLLDRCVRIPRSRVRVKERKKGRVILLGGSLGFFNSIN